MMALIFFVMFAVVSWISTAPIAVGGCGVEPGRGPCAVGIQDTKESAAGVALALCEPRSPRGHRTGSLAKQKKALLLKDLCYGRV